MASELHDRIAARVAPHLHAGEVVNLGIGIPTLVPDHLTPGQTVVLQSENGMLGVGPAPRPEEADPLLVNASKHPVTALPGASYFSSSDSFALIRGGHISTCVLGALQIDERGRVANWAVPGKPILGVGGAMDLLVGAKRVILATQHRTRDGEPKLLARCSLPLSGERPADLIVTEAATFRVRAGGLVLVEIAAGFDAEWVDAHTAAAYSTDIRAPNSTTPCPR